MKSVLTIKNIEDDLKFILYIDGIVRHLFTSLDAFACCVYIVDSANCPNGSQADEEKKLFKQDIKKTVEIANRVNAYQSIVNLVNSRDEFKYLSEYRNLLTHRPFYQFCPDDTNSYHLPNSLNQLDSTTQAEVQYMPDNAVSYISTTFDLIIHDLEKALLDLNDRYRQQI